MNSAESASVQIAQLQGPYRHAWHATVSVSALLRAWWNTALACVLSKQLSTTVQTMTRGIHMRITLVLAPSLTAALDTCAWEQCPCYYHACFATLLPRHA